MIVSGQTGCGKTVFVKKFIEHYGSLFDKVLFAYMMYQPIYDEIAQLASVEFHHGFPNVTMSDEKTLLVLDDMMMENDKLLAKYFTRMRHANLSTLFVTQNFFFDSKYMRTVSRNAHYLILFNNPRDAAMIHCLGRQMFIDKPKFLPDAFRQATEEPYSYLLIDCKPNSKHRVKQGIFPGEEFCIYKPA